MIQFNINFVVVFTLSRGELCLIDWKTSRKQKPTLKDCFDYPLQVVAYAGAVNQNRKMFSFKV